MTINNTNQNGNLPGTISDASKDSSHEDNKISDKSYKGRSVKESTITSYTDKQPSECSEKGIEQRKVLARQSKSPSFFSSIKGLFGCTTSNDVDDLAHQNLDSQNSHDVLSSDFFSVKRTPSRINLKEMLSLETVRKTVLNRHKKEHLKRTRKTKVRQDKKESCVEVKLRGNSIKKIEIDEVYIGPSDGTGVVTTFDPGINEQRVTFDNGKEALVHKDGRYIILNEMEVIKGFEDKYYAFIKNVNYVTEPGYILVINRGFPVFIPIEYGEECLLHDEGPIVYCIDGRMKKLKCDYPTDGFFDNSYQLNYPFRDKGMGTLEQLNRVNLLRMPSPEKKYYEFQEALDILTAVQTPEDAAKSLKELFQRKDEMSFPIFRSNDYLVNREGLFEFIELYHKAIMLESKVEKKGASRTYKKRHEIKTKQKLSAIKEVKEFVRGLDPTEPDYEMKLYCSMQMLGRIHDPLLIKSTRMNIRHASLLMQAVWKEKPLKMVQVAIEMLSNSEGAFEVDAPEPGYQRKFKLPKYFDLDKAGKSYVDFMLIAALYNMDPNIPRKSKRLQDGMLARYLGLPVKQAKENPILSRKEEKAATEQLLDDLCIASKHNVSIYTSLKGDLGFFIQFKYKERAKIEKNMGVVHYVLGKKSVYSRECASNRIPVLITKFERKKVKGKSLVSLKLQSDWGEEMFLEMKEKDFLMSYVRNITHLLNAPSDMKFNSFKDLDDDIVYLIESSDFFNGEVYEEAVVECLNGNIYNIHNGEAKNINGRWYSQYGEEVIVGERKRDK